MDNALGPREIQARIRSGRSIDEVTEIAGLPRDKVERFAAPVLAEREYVAQQAMGAPVRRRGETSGHRKLRVAVAERLSPRHVDIDDVTWDSARMEDGRWAVTAAIRVEDAERRAIFHYDVPGRFSVAGNDDARWFLGEGMAGADADEEPTVDLNDDLAIVRSVSRPRADEEPAAREGRSAPPDDNVVALRAERPSAAPAQAAPQQPERREESVSAGPAPAGDEPEAHNTTATEPGLGGLDILYDILDRSGTEFTEDSVEILRREPGSDEPDDTDGADTPEPDEAVGPGSDETAGPKPDEAAQAEPGPDRPEAEKAESRQPAVDDDDATHGPEEPAAEDPVVEDPGVEDPAGDDVSDAAAVPDTGSAEFEAQAPPPQYPVEPSLFDDDPEVSAQLAATTDPPARTEHVTGPPGGSTDQASGAPDRAADHTSAEQGPPSAVKPQDAASAVPPEQPAAGAEAEEAPAEAAPTSDREDEPVPEQPVPEQPVPEQPAPHEPEPQEAAAEEPEPATKPAPKKRSRKRASVPSWDEIMFGSPRSKR